jgi:hypothetical protein
MKASELRIGNYVKFKGCGDKPFKVFRIDTTESSTFTTAEPITLTEEWLLRLGFEAKGKARIHKFIVIWLENEEFVFALRDPFKGTTHLTKIQHIHQLQNLYFALTGEELVLTNNIQPNEQH